MKTTISTEDLLADHSVNVEFYFLMSRTAAEGYPLPLTEDQRNAYLLLPQLIDDCKRSYDLIPADAPGRPAHYLMLLPSIP